MADNNNDKKKKSKDGWDESECFDSTLLATCRCCRTCCRGCCCLGRVGCKYSLYLLGIIAFALFVVLFYAAIVSREGIVDKVNHLYDMVVKKHEAHRQAFYAPPQTIPPQPAPPRKKPDDL